MGKKYQSKKSKKHHSDALADGDSNGPSSPSKEKKIVKEPKTKETILSDIELQIVDMFSRSFTNGQIGVKYPQQKKKGMMRLMNFCFRTIIEEAELYINASLQKEAHNSKCVDKRERTIFYLSSNYRYKHIEKSLLEDFKIICKNYVKYHCLEHIDPKFLEKFYKKVIFNQFCAETPDSFKNSKVLRLESIQNQHQIDDYEEPQQKKVIAKSPKKSKKVEKSQTTPAKKKQIVSKRGRKKKNDPIQIELPKDLTMYQTHEKQCNELEIASLMEPTERQLKSNKICIEKINIYLGYDSKMAGRKQGCEQDLTKIKAHPYARMEVQQNQCKLMKRKWTHDMEAELIDQFMNISATSPNIIIRNLMKKFGRNKLFVESQIQTKRKDMYKTSITKFIHAFEGKTLCSQEAVRKMETSLRNMSLSPKNYFIAGFIHDFYFKEVQAISVTLLSQYINKLNKQETMTDKGHSQADDHEEEESLNDKKKILERQDLKYALNTMSKLVSNYNYDLIE